MLILFCSAIIAVLLIAVIIDGNARYTRKDVEKDIHHYTLKTDTFSINKVKLGTEVHVNALVKEQAGTLYGNGAMAKTQPKLDFLKKKS